MQFYLGAGTPTFAPGLVLALHSGITPCGLEGSAGNQTPAGHVEGKSLTHCSRPCANFNLK